MGLAWFSWWVITMTVFFIPYGLITAELGAAWPGEGGVYVWVREAFGPIWGSTAAWMYWINNAYWIPSVYLIFAGTFEQIFLKTHSTWQEAGIAIALTWLTVVIGVVRLEVSKWVPNLGAVVKALIFLALGVLGLSALRARPRPANDFSLARPGAEVERHPRVPAGAALLDVRLRADELGRRRDEEPAARRAERDPLVGRAHRDPLLVGDRRDPLRGADRASSRS